MSIIRTFSFFACIASSAANAQSNLQNIVAIQQARIQRLEEGLKDDCGSYGQVVFNSVANYQGTKATADQNTRLFWNIPYADRFKSKGQATRTLSRNYYNGGLYRIGPAVYTDVFEDLTGKIVPIFRAQADGIDETTMKFINPRPIGGNQKKAYNEHFGSGWASADKDLDILEGTNCATYYGSVTQHYGACWYYNLGADADSTILDDDWGPHINSDVLAPAGSGVQTDNTPYTRVSRITRCVKPL